MNGMHMYFFQYPGQPWRCILRSTFGHKHARPKAWLTNAENMMRGVGRDRLFWRLNDERARRLIWC